MKKLCAILAGVLLFFVTLVGFKPYMDQQIAENADGLRNLRSYERFWSSEAQKIIIDENTLPVFGSSELVGLSKYEDGVGSFLNGEQMNIITIGAGNFQSLYHAIALGALADNIKSDMVALFLSPQWFEEEGCLPNAFASRMSENELLDFLSNEAISKEQKLYVLDRVETLLQNSPLQLSRVRKYRNAMEHPMGLDAVYMQVMSMYWDYRAEFDVYKQINQVSKNLPCYDLDSIDFASVLELAEQQGKTSCTNNAFGVYDSYWDTYVAETYSAGEVVNKVQRYTQSPEYDDLHCFLKVAEELGVEVVLVSIPVNGRWYEYQGTLCDEYYQNIRDIAAQYRNVTLADMSIYEDELYFLKDVMHLGWKGWARVNEVLYTEFVK